MTADRTEAAARAMCGPERWDDGMVAPEIMDALCGQAGYALAAADAYDAAHGIRRVRVDAEAVERAVAEISHHLTPVIGRNRLHDRDGNEAEPLRPAIESAARAVIAALTGKAQP